MKQCIWGKRDKAGSNSPRKGREKLKTPIVRVIGRASAAAGVHGMRQGPRRGHGTCGESEGEPRREKSKTAESRWHRDGHARGQDSRQQRASGELSHASRTRKQPAASISTYRTEQQLVFL